MTTIAFVHFPSDRTYLVADRRFTGSSGWIHNAPQQKKWDAHEGFALATTGEIGVCEAIMDVAPAVREDYNNTEKQTAYLEAYKMFELLTKHINEHPVLKFQSPKAIEEEGNKTLLFTADTLTVYRLTVDNVVGSAYSHTFDLSKFDFIAAGSGAIIFEAAVKTAQHILFPPDNRLFEDSKKLASKIEAGILKAVMEIVASLDVYTSPECDIVLVSDLSENHEESGDN